jgi:YesN/AraC family two-component response regulator
MKAPSTERSKHPALWLDMTVSVRDAGAPSGFENAFEIQHRSPLASIHSDVDRLKPVVAFFDFDFPTKPGLQLLRDTKREFPSLPLVMLTVQHSEALAVWAFRSRVWDYMVKPIPRSEVERCVHSLEEMLVLRRSQATRTAAIPGATIPEEHRSGGRDLGSLTLAAAVSYVEQNYSSKITSAQAAALCGLSAFQFSRSFKDTYDVTFQEYVMRFRIREACRLLRNPAAQVADVAALVGFGDPSYFCKIFKRYTDTSPSQFSAASDASDLAEKLLGTMQI